MKDFLRYSKNRFLYSFFKLLVLIAIGFLIGSINVKADVLSYKIQNRTSLPYDTYWSANESYTYEYDQIEQSSQNRYMILRTCSTDYLDYSITSNSAGKITQIGNSVANTKCDTDGNSGWYIDYYFYIDSFYQTTGVYVNTFNLKVHNSRSYKVYQSLINLYTVPDLDTVPDYTDKLNNIQGSVDNTNKKLDQAENTRKGIWETIKSIPGIIGNFFDNLGTKIGSFFDNLATKIGNFFKDLLDGIIEGLKKLFIPEDDYFKNWFDDFKTYFEEKLGFIATPFTIIIDFVNSYLNLSSSNDIIIDVPDITVPNFEENKIVSATTFNWSQTLRSKQALNALWQLYLSFIDVYLILNFINLCENKYNRIFGGDTSNYEYYTVEDSYTFDNDTGEVLSARRNERTTTRKKVE